MFDLNFKKGQTELFWSFLSIRAETVQHAGSTAPRFAAVAGVRRPFSPTGRRGKRISSVKLDTHAKSSQALAGFVVPVVPFSLSRASSSPSPPPPRCTSSELLQPCSPTQFACHHPSNPKHRPPSLLVLQQSSIAATFTIFARHRQQPFMVKPAAILFPPPKPSP